MGVTISKDTVDDVVKAVQDLTKKRVLVGIPETKDYRDDGSPVGNAVIGYLNEFGGDRIPPRPHLVPGIETVLPRAIDYLQKAGQYALEGKKGKVMEGLYAVGMICQSSVRLKITAVIPPPLAPRTIAARRAKGHMGTTPLLETGNYIQHISFVIRDRGE